VQSLGAKFVELPLETSAAEDKGGYAKAQDEAFYARQRELLTRVGRGQRRGDHDGRRARAEGPRAGDGRHGGRHGTGIGGRRSRAERGGNCELTRADETVTVGASR